MTRTARDACAVAAVVEHGHKEEVVAAAALGVEPLLPEDGAELPTTTQDIRLEVQLTGEALLVDMAVVQLIQVLPKLLKLFNKLRNLVKIVAN